MGWIYLFLASLLEMSFTYFLELSRVHKLAWVGFGCCYLGSGFFITQAVRSIPASIAYPVLTGTGSIFIILAGIVYFKQSLSPAQLFFLIAIVISVVGLKILGK